MARQFSHPLKHPITVTIKGPSGERDETITQLNFNFPERIKAKHLRATDGATGEVGKTLALLAAFGDQPVKVLDEMDAEDLGELSALVEGFQ